jgi:hypothetical protein
MKEESEKLLDKATRAIKAAETSPFMIIFFA